MYWKHDMINIPKPIPGFQTQTLDGEVVLLHPTKAAILHLNQTGALVWQLCNGIRSVTEIVIILSEAYPEARGQIEADVPKIIYELAAQGALFKE
jgi:hypothetical protein